MWVLAILHSYLALFKVRKEIQWGLGRNMLLFFASISLNYEPMNFLKQQLFNFRFLEGSIVPRQLWSEYLSSSSCVSGTGLSILHILFHLILTTNLGRNYYYHVHCKVKKTRVWLVSNIMHIDSDKTNTRFQVFQKFLK